MTNGEEKILQSGLMQQKQNPLFKAHYQSNLPNEFVFYDFVYLK